MSIDINFRPTSLDQVFGQGNITKKDSIFRKIVESGNIPSMIFYGPPGVGKTTVARIIAKNSNYRLFKLNGTSATTESIRSVITASEDSKHRVLLYLDEIQYLTKKHQQLLLESLEDGNLTLIASTTENPIMYVFNALVSRCHLVEFFPVNENDLYEGLKSTVETISLSENGPLEADEDALRALSVSSNGDVRKAVGTLVLMAIAVSETTKHITMETLLETTPRSIIRHDRDGDTHYDVISAYQKSMRGSNPDAALHYLARLLSSGDMASACRRLMVCACEDVGMADPNVMTIVKSAVDIANAVGMPEARLPLANATVLVATSKKSNWAYTGINAAMNDVENKYFGDIPRHLKNHHQDASDVEHKGQHYKNPHIYGYENDEQEYMPNGLIGKKYL